MGPSIAAAGSGLGAFEKPCRGRRRNTTLVIAFAMSTPLVRMAAWVNALPVWRAVALQTGWRSDELSRCSRGRFRLAGGAAAAFAAARDQRTEMRGPTVDRNGRCSGDRRGSRRVAPDASFRRSSLGPASPTIFRDPGRGGDDASRWTATCTGWCGRRPGRGGALAVAGTPRSSLRHCVYRIHAERSFMAYATWPIRHRLRSGRIHHGCVGWHSP